MGIGWKNIHAAGVRNPESAGRQKVDGGGAASAAQPPVLNQARHTFYSEKVVNTTVNGLSNNSTEAKIEAKIEAKVVFRNGIGVVEGL